MNSVICGQNYGENQVLYDSRKYVKGKVFHRLDDVFSFLSLGKKVYVEVMSKGLKLEGYLMSFDTTYLQLRIKERINIISIKDVLEIKIINVLS